MARDATHVQTLVIVENTDASFTQQRSTIMLPGARKDTQLNTPGWHKLQELIEGVFLHEVLHVPRDHGVITEVFRPEWDPSGQPIVHVYQSRLFPGAVGA